MRSDFLSLALWALPVLGTPLANQPRHSYGGQGQEVFSFPLENGFPNIKPGSWELKAIEKQAHGTLPNGALPTKISDTSAAVFSLIAGQEIFEVAYFTSLIHNITNKVPGYEIGSKAARTVILNALTAVQAQEELHAIGVNGILTTSGHDAIQPCKYTFPVDNFDDAIALAATFTDVVLGTLQAALQAFGADGDAEDFVGLIGSVIAQEGEQTGFFRTISSEGKIPSSKPFLTASSPEFAFSVLNQIFVVPGSCPNPADVPIFKPLTVVTTDLSPETTSVEFMVNAPGADTSGWKVSYISGQNEAIVESIRDIR